MTTRKTRSLLWLVMSVLLAATAVLVGWQLLVPPVIEAGTDGSRDESVTSPGLSVAHGPVSVDQSSLIAAANKDIRQRLFDPPVETPKPPPPKPLPPIDLISTILRAEGDHSAWVRDGQSTRKVAKGDQLGPDENKAVILAITADRLIVEHEGKRIEIEQAAAGGGRR